MIILTRLALCLSLTLAPLQAFAASATLYNPAPNALYDTTGAIAKGAKAYFYSAGTSTPLTVYQDAGLTTPHTFPIVAGLNGVLQKIYLPYVDYRVRITTAAGAVIFDADNIANPVPATAGGGGGTPANQIFNTGYIISRLTGGTLDGFVRMNGQTIGSGSSSATERANDDAEDLFLYLCNNLPDTIAVMSGGRGANCAADWAANKNIVVPSMQGRLMAGVDDMGGTAANVLQTSTTASATSGSPTITVASATGLARTMYAIIDGVATGQITAISGTTVTLSANYAGSTGAGKAVRFSFLSDAQTAGLPGGAQSASMTVMEMVSHNHGVNDPGHVHSIGIIPGTLGGGPLGSYVQGPSNSGASATGISIQANGQSRPSSIVQPSRLATFYMKL
ncbi:MAG: hypothetical protein WC069_07340 [Candidatus Shapirobacteria bacterium]